MKTITENLRLLRLCMLALTMLLCATAATPAGAQNAIKLTPQPDSKLVFVSPQGSDSNPGTSPEQAVMSLARGFALLRDGQPDWLLLERGHDYELTTETQLPTGPSKTAPAVIAAFGKGDAPTLDVGPNHARFGIEQQIQSNTKVHGVNLIGLYPDLYADRPELDKHGWTILEPSEDSRIIYVSSSEGDDRNNGLSPETPLKTIAKGVSYMRNGYPDWLKLKAGDTFDEKLPEWRRKLGKSAEEPHVITSYGDGPRPIITRGFFTISGGWDADADRGNVAVRGIYFYSRHLDPNSRYFGGDGANVVGWLDYGRNILFEDCKFRFVQLQFQTFRSSKPIENIKIRRCMVLDNYVSSYHPQGLFAADTNQLLIEENVFDHNGWNRDVVDAKRSIFNQNIYIKHSHNTTILRNIISRGGSYAIKIASDKPSGMKNTLVKDNLMIENVNAVTTKGTGKSVDGYQHDQLKIAGNVVTEHGGVARVPHAWGFEIVSAKNLSIENNVFLNQDFSTNSYLWRFWNLPHQNVSVANNVAWNWSPGVEKLKNEEIPNGVEIKANWYDSSDGKLFDSTRTIESYAKERTQYDSWSDLLQSMRNRPARTWHAEIRPYAPQCYIKAGFSKVLDTNY